ncbi:MAG TPA: CsbD family protein [Gaiellaceae bacterium]|nr:CsbD family protein [Gaiellaceae bacterium]
MSFLDRLLGRGKKAAGDMTDNPEMRREGAHQEAEGMAEERADQAEDMAQEAREDAAEHRAERNDPM